MGCSLLKGVFVLPDGLPVVFQYNPEEISEKREVEYAIKQPMFFSHPVYHYQYGKGNEFSFKMVLRDHSRIGDLKIPMPIELQVESLQDLTYPIRKLGEMIDAPPKICFVFSAYVRMCKIKSIEVERKDFDKFLLARSATIKISLFEVVDECKNRKNSWKNIFGRAAKGLF
jgi:hypothetical protein